MKTYKRHDLLTGEPFTTTSSIKRFKTRKNQILYNNIKNRDIRKNHKFIDEILRKNVSILAEVLGDKKQIIIKNDILDAKNFNYTVITHFINKNNQTHLCFYDYRLVKQNNNTFKIIKDGNLYATRL